MKIAIIGYSGSGKSSLARKLGEIYGIPAMHLDSVHMVGNWEIRGEDESKYMLKEFMNKPDWIIDGTYKKYYIKERLKQADYILLLNFNRIDCFIRCMKRYQQYRGSTRPDLSEGCNEKMDAEFIRWLLYEGRTKRHKNFFLAVKNKYGSKTIVIKNQCELDLFIKFNEIQKRLNDQHNSNNKLRKKNFSRQRNTQRHFRQGFRRR